MPTMTKRVNVRATVAVRNTNPPIYGTYKNIIMTTGDILKCLTKRAVVDEILPDGSLVRLNFKNYYTDNGAGLDAKGEGKVIKPKQPPVVKKVAPTKEVVKEPEVSFNENPISKADETVDNTVTATENPVEDEIKADDITVVSGTMDEEGVKVNLSNGETVVVTHDEIIAAATEEAKVDTNEETTSTVEAANAEVKIENTDTQESTAAESAKNVTEGNPVVPEKKPTTSAKKKSTSSKKKK